MIIAINYSTIEGGFTDNNTAYFHECFSRLAKLHPQHEFLYIFDKPFDEAIITSENISAHMVGTVEKNPLLLLFKTNYTISLFLRKRKVDIFITNGACSMRAKIPQCLIVNDDTFLLQPAFLPKQWVSFYKNNTVKFLRRSKAAVTAAAGLQQQLIDLYETPATKIATAPFGINKKNVVLLWQQATAVKKEYTEGKEYFLYTGPVHSNQHLTTLLKAFSLFKKRQLSNMQLIIAGTGPSTDSDFIKSLDNYKFRDDVTLIENTDPELLFDITAAAYAVVYPSQQFYYTVTAPLSCGVPIITGRSAMMEEIFGDAVLYIDIDSHIDVSEKMMLLFKDETKRNELIVKGTQRAELYNWDNTAATIWQVILKCAADIEQA